MAKAKKKTKWFGEVSDGEGLVTFCRTRDDLLDFVADNGPCLIGEFELDSRSASFLKKSFKDKDIHSVGLPVKRFKKELEHYDWFPTG
jgi:hypothetical protein